MFTRFRQTPTRLQVSLVETRRIAGRVSQSHVATLGTIVHPPLPSDRIAFWTKLHPRLAGLANRIDEKMRGTILAAVHARIPMPTLEDQRAVQLKNLRAEARLWTTLSEVDAEEVAGEKALQARLAQKTAEREAAAASATHKAQAAADRLARAERGEDVGAIGKPMTRAEVLAALNLTPAQLQHCLRVAEISDLGGFDDLVAEIMKRRDKVERAAARAILKRRLHG